MTLQPGALGTDRDVSDAIDAVANAQNRTYLLMDAKACIEDGVRPDALPTTREYRWVHPGTCDIDLSYKEALRTVLERYYEEHDDGEEGGSR